MTAHTPDGGGLTEAERDSLLTEKLELAYDNMHAEWARNIVYAAVERILAARATHADPRETAAAALEEALAAHPPTYTERAADPQTFYCPPCSEAIGDWVTWTPAHVAADLRAGVREGRDT
jgi:hypothetical protein